MFADSQNADNRRYKRGFTLLETLIAFLLFSVLMGVSAYLFTVSLRAWGTGRLRTEVREDMSYAMEKTVRDLKEMANGSLSQYLSIAHTIQYDDLSGNRHVLYLYNADDGTLDSTYSESLYDLHKADISGGDTPASGDGKLILRDLVSPDAAALSTALTIDPNGTQVTLDFVVQRNDEIVRTRTKVRPRNL
jgi:prepilin-type N-terminal cleavage/methylation domain-containing protein